MSREAVVVVPLELWDKPHWEMRGRVDAPTLFRALSSDLPEATTLFLEGTSIEEDVQSFLRMHEEDGPYLPARQTIWPAPLQFRLPAIEPILNGLAGLSENHAEPEIADHLFVYEGRAPLIEYPDAFDAPLFLAGHLAPERIHSLAHRLGVEVVDARGLTSECS